MKPAFRLCSMATAQPILRSFSPWRRKRFSSDRSRCASGVRAVRRIAALFSAGSGALFERAGLRNCVGLRDCKSQASRPKRASLERAGSLAARLATERCFLGGRIQRPEWIGTAILQPGCLRQVFLPWIFILDHRPPQQPAGGAPGIDDISSADRLATRSHHHDVVFEARVRVCLGPMQHQGLERQLSQIRPDAVRPIKAVAVVPRSDMNEEVFARPRSGKPAIPFAIAALNGVRFRQKCVRPDRRPARASRSRRENL